MVEGKEVVFDEWEVSLLLRGKIVYILF
jgi:hypothetical protein